ncbi:toll/interleukin-1 receptor domain-containing protein [Candidatus Poribacteria bacterium]
MAAFDVIKAIIDEIQRFRQSKKSSEDSKRIADLARLLTSQIEIWQRVHGSFYELNNDFGQLRSCIDTEHYHDVVSHVDGLRIRFTIFEKEILPFFPRDHHEYDIQEHEIFMDGSIGMIADNIKVLSSAISSGRKTILEFHDIVSGLPFDDVVSWDGIQFLSHELYGEIARAHNIATMVVGMSSVVTREITPILRFLIGQVPPSVWETPPSTGEVISSHIFISYVSENTEQVQKLKKDLTKHGIEVWVAQEELPPGAWWKQDIRRAISRGTFFIACFSKEYNKRNRTYMNEELILALEELRLRPNDKKWFIPVKLSECEIPDWDIGLGKTLKDIQYAELYKDWETGVGRILQVIHPSQEG